MRQHLSYANAAATLALVLAMSGGALAANHYLINSTHQINPRVLKALKGKRGARGQTGPAGVAGVGIQGLRGEPGPKGLRGEVGKEGPRGFSPGSPLPSGESESGDYGMRSQAEGLVSETYTYPLPLQTAPAHVLYVPIATAPVTHCTGPGHADRGYLCIYSISVTAAEPPAVANYEAKEAEGGKGEGEAGPGRVGFELSWNAAKEGRDHGTYTVTAE